MKRFVIFLALIFVAQFFKSQVSLQILNYRPTGSVYGFLFKPINSGELGFILPFTKKVPFRAGISFMYLRMKTRMDTFPIYATLSGLPNHATVLGGKESYQKYNLFKIFVGGDWAFINKEKFKMYVGADLILGTSSVQYYYEINTQINFQYSGGGLITGIRGRIGTEYYLTDELAVFISATRGYFNITDGLNKIRASANEFGFGIRYDFLNLR